MAHAECPMAIALQEDRVVRGMVAMAERPDGSRVDFEPYPNPLHDESGQVVGGVNVLIDVTDRRRAERELDTTASALAASSAVKDDFLGLISHELRTPVTTIYGNAQLLRQRSESLAVRDQEMLGDIADDAERLLAIIENLLLLDRLQAGARPELEPQILTHVISQEIAAFQRRHPELVVTLDRARRHLIVDADHTHLMLLLQNLLDNAAKDGGGGPIGVTVAADGDEVQVRVLDRGLGIDEQEAAALFAPFYRARAAQRTAGGLGLGLALCERIVSGLDGRIWALPRPGGGSEFGFALPIASEPNDQV